MIKTLSRSISLVLLVGLASLLAASQGDKQKPQDAAITFGVLKEWFSSDEFGKSPWKEIEVMLIKTVRLRKTKDHTFELRTEQGHLRLLAYPRQQVLFMTFIPKVRHRLSGAVLAALIAKSVSISFENADTIVLNFYSKNTGVVTTRHTLIFSLQNEAWIQSGFSASWK